MDDDRAYKLIRAFPEEYSEADRDRLEFEFEWGDSVKRGIRKHLDRIAYKWVSHQVKSGDPSFAYLATKFEWEEERDRQMAEDIRHRNEGKMCDKWFVTFNPPPDFSPAQLWEAVKTYLQNNCPKFVKGAWLRIEQRSEDPDTFTGWHLHVAIEYQQPRTRSVILQRMGTAINQIWSKEQQQAPEFRRHHLTAYHLAAHHHAYMLGEKTDDKMQKVHVDKIAREAYGFPENLFVGSEIIFPGKGIVSENGIPQISPEEAGSEALP